MTGFWSALRFLTILPAPARRETDEVVIGQSLIYFPLVGLLLGAILLGLHFLLSLALPALLVNAAIVVALIILTGAHHIDGLMDTCDGVIAGKTREERLAMMSDKRTGTFAIAGAISIILLKYAALTSVPAQMPALLLMPTLSRWTMVGVIFLFPYARPTGMGLAYKKGARWYRFVIATAIALTVAFGIMELRGIALMAALSLLIFGFAFYLRTRLGGLTGDTYGAINEVAEFLVLTLIILLWRS